MKGFTNARFALTDEVLSGLRLKLQLLRVTRLLFLYMDTDVYRGKEKRFLKK